MKKQAVIEIFGRVQGVNFRWATRRLAQRLGLFGWVRNEPDGSVKIVAQGEEGKIKELIERLGNGLTFARVDKIEVGWTETEEQFNDFRIEY